LSTPGWRSRFHISSGRWVAMAAMAKETPQAVTVALVVTVAEGAPHQRSFLKKKRKKKRKKT